MATLGRSGDETLARPVRGGAGRGAAGRRASRSTTRRCSTSTPIRRIPIIGDRALAEDAGHGGAARRRHRPRPAGQRRGGLRQALSRARRHVGRLAPRAAARRASARSHPPRRVRAVSRRDRRRRRVHHDRARPRAVARRGAARDAVAGASSSGLLREELGFRRRDPERRPRDEGDCRRPTPCRTRPCRRLRPAATALLVCSGDVETCQAQRRSRRWSTPSKTDASRSSALEDALARHAPREGALPRGAGRRRGRHATRCARFSAATSIGASPTRWRAYRLIDAEAC